MYLHSTVGNVAVYTNISRETNHFDFAWFLCSTCIPTLRAEINSSSISSRRRWLSIRSATFQLSSDYKVFYALGTAVLVVAKCWSCVPSTPLACVPVARCNLSSQIVSGSWRLIYRLVSSCTVQLVTSFTKAWTFLIFLGQAFQTWNIFKYARRAFAKGKGRERCTVLSVWLSII